MKPYVVICFLLSVLFNIVYGNVPVLLWESSKYERINSFPAFHRITSEDFKQYILKKVHGEQPVPLIVGFVEESLSMEDFSKEDAQGVSYLPQLKYIIENAASKEFLPSVQDPIDSTKQLSDLGYSVQIIDSNKNVELPEDCGKILIVKLPEAKFEEDRPDLLRNHDSKISEIYSQLLSKCSHVIAFLSGQQSSWVEPEEITRLRRSPEDQSNVTSTSTPNIIRPVISGSHVVFQDSKGLSLLYSSMPPKLVQDGKEVLLPNTSVTSGDSSKPSDIKLIVKYNGDKPMWLTFNFDNKTNGYWYLRTVEFKSDTEAPIILKPTTELHAPLAMSFHSGLPVTFSNRTAKTTLTFEDLQMQPFFLKPGSKSFAAAVDAVGFFTPAIWSGIFVTFLLALIFTWGLGMIMDIRTMDQFDDPKGKTITVTASD